MLWQTVKHYLQTRHRNHRRPADHSKTLHWYKLSVLKCIAETGKWSRAAGVLTQAALSTSESFLNYRLFLCSRGYSWCCCKHLYPGFERICILSSLCFPSPSRYKSWTHLQALQRYNTRWNYSLESRITKGYRSSGYNGRSASKHKIHICCSRLHQFCSPEVNRDPGNRNFHCHFSRPVLGSSSTSLYTYRDQTGLNTAAWYRISQEYKAGFHPLD